MFSVGEFISPSVLHTPLQVSKYIMENFVGDKFFIAKKLLSLPKIPFAWKSYSI